MKYFYDRTRDLIDQHDPDVLYFDNSRLPLGWGGMNIAAYYYNRSISHRGGKVDVVANIKNVPAHLVKSVVSDFERGLNNEIMPYVWQSETCIGSWHYDRGLYDKPGEFGGYLHPRDVVHWLVDTVSKNGVFVLNIPGKPDGTIDSKEIAVLDKITAWMSVNSEAIYETRPWKIFGEGPNKVASGAFHGDKVASLGARDVRFTRSKDNRVIYAILLGLPRQGMTLEALGLSTKTSPRQNREDRCSRCAASSNLEANGEQPDDHRPSISIRTSGIRSSPQSVSPVRQRESAGLMSGTLSA